MLYYVIRGIFIFLILLVLFIFIIVKNKKYYGKFFVKKQQSNKTLYKRKHKKLSYILSFISFFLVLDLIYYPFEGYFIKFDSLEQSIRYSVYDSYTSSISVAESDDTVFFTQNSNNNISYHSIAKYNDSYGLCDFNTKTGSFDTSQEYINESNFKGLLKVDYILNKNTNEICYFIKLTKMDKDNNNSIKVFGSTEDELKAIYSDTNVTIFYLISDKQLTQSDYFSFLGKKYSFV